MEERALNAHGASRATVHANAGQRPRRQNRRTGLILLSVALVFFVGVIVRRWLLGG